jgi:hypothetical protein
LRKELVPTTIVTKEPKVVYKVSYKPARSSVERLYEDSTNNCVQFAKTQTGINRPLGNGGRAGVNSYSPRIGAIGVLKGSPHAVVVESIDGEMVTFRESNYFKNWITRRSLPLSSFLGYII